MKRWITASIYILGSALIVAAGFWLSPYLGVWRMGSVGILILLAGFLLCRGKCKTAPTYVNDGNSRISSVILLACAILTVIVLRFITAASVTALEISVTLPYEGVGFGLRFLSTVLLPSLCTPLLAFYVMPSVLCPKKKWTYILTVALGFLPFCTSVVYLPSALVLGAVMAVNDSGKMQDRFVDCFSAYLVLVFYDTFAVSFGSICMHLSVRNTIVLLFMAGAITMLFSYLALRPLKEKKLRVGELFTVILIALIIFMIGIAI